MPSDDAVSVIMPTGARRERGRSLLQAVDSVLDQEGARGIPLVMVNGPAAELALVEALRGRPSVRLAVLPEPGFLNALRAGRELVDTPFFAELDDDDELLPDALAVRLRAIRHGVRAEAVVTNGFLRSAGRDEVNIPDFRWVERDPLRAVLRHNWLVPCSGLFRTEAIPARVFAEMPKCLEWTYLALRLALAGRVRFVNRPTFVYRTDSPLSLWRSVECRRAQPAGLRQLLDLDLPRDVRASFERKIGRAQYDLALLALEEGDPAAAWRWYRLSLSARGGFGHPATSLRILGRLVSLALARRSAKTAAIERDV